NLTPGGGHAFVDLTGIALAHGLAIAVMVSATMSVSGGHLNPAVTLGALMGKRIAPADAGGYVLAQLAGGAAGAWLALRSLGGDVAAVAAGTPALGSGVPLAVGIMVEAI